MNSPQPARRFSSGLGQEHFEHGPIHLIIDLDGPQESVRLGFDRAFARFETILDELVVDLEQLRTEAAVGLVFASGVARHMNNAALLVPGFATPMVAVAGAVADEICGVLAEDDELSRIVVNNGGDIAFSLSPGELLRVGTVANISDSTLSGRATIASDSSVRGVATSGCHGRSLSLGIADSVTVFARSAALADASATVIANAVNVDSSAVVRRSAVTLDASSDLGERLVTVEVGELSSGEIASALAAGRQVASSLLQTGAIDGAALFLRDEWCSVGDRELVSL